MAYNIGALFFVYMNYVKMTLAGQTCYYISHYYNRHTREKIYVQTHKYCMEKCCAETVCCKTTETTYELDSSDFGSFIPLGAVMAISVGAIFGLCMISVGCFFVYRLCCATFYVKHPSSNNRQSTGTTHETTEPTSFNIAGHSTDDHNDTNCQNMNVQPPKYENTVTTSYNPPAYELNQTSDGRATNDRDGVENEYSFITDSELNLIFPPPTYDVSIAAPLAGNVTEHSQCADSCQHNNNVTFDMQDLPPAYEDSIPSNSQEIIS